MSPLGWKVLCSDERFDVIPQRNISFQIKGFESVCEIGSEIRDMNILQASCYNN